MKQDEYDVIVIGSGGTGLCAALAAAKEKASVLVLEAFRAWGGTTGFSGGLLWIPNHHYMQAVGGHDSRQDIIAYLKTCMAGRDDMERWEAFADNAPKMLRFLEQNTPLRFSPVYFPDSFADLPGGSTYRHVEPNALKMNVIGHWKRLLIDQKGINDSAPFPLTYAEIMTMLKKGLKAVFQKSLVIPYRMATGRVTQQKALLGGLLKGCLDNGVEIVLNARATQLIQAGGRVVGLKGELDGKAYAVRARRGVIMATGGFSWNEAYKKEFLPGPLEHCMTPATNLGDAIGLSRQVGARLSRMEEAWYWAAIHKPGLEWEGKPLGLIAIYVRTLPHSIVVNRQGKRFANESAHNFANSFYDNKDVKNGEFPNLPCWAVFDQNWRDSSSEFAAGISPSKPDPEFLHKAGTLRDLAKNIGIDPEGLVATVERFNQFARDGKDLDFHRGESAYDQFYTRTRLYGKWQEDASTTGNLGTIARPPFYALELKTSSVGTKGGTMTNRWWQAVREDGSAIDGLYAVGNCSAAIIGPITVAAASTLGTGMTAAYIAGRHAALSGMSDSLRRRSK
jgi:3-oxosteroid 1-dehydrogenase